MPEYHTPAPALFGATCPWCRDPCSTDDEPDYDALCRCHQAEYEGLSVSELERRDREQYAEYRDTLS